MMNQYDEGWVNRAVPHTQSPWYNAVDAAQASQRPYRRRWTYRCLAVSAESRRVATRPHSRGQGPLASNECYNCSRYLPERKWHILLGYFQPIMGYFTVFKKVGSSGLRGFLQVEGPSHWPVSDSGRSNLDVCGIFFNGYVLGRREFRAT